MLTIYAHCLYCSNLVISCSILLHRLPDNYSLIWSIQGWGRGWGEGHELYRKVTVTVWFCKLSLNVLMFVTVVAGYINGPNIEWAKYFVTLCNSKYVGNMAMQILSQTFSLFLWYKYSPVPSKCSTDQKLLRYNILIDAFVAKWKSIEPLSIHEGSCAQCRLVILLHILMCFFSHSVDFVRWL